MYRPEDLNEIQMRAVLDTEGAVLVTAGAGSGKTRLLTHRIAHLIKDLNVPPYNILAITFTNKAAGEMRERLESMLDDTNGIWIFTFHAACVRILRRFIDKIGFDKNFTIYGETETKAVVKRICKDNDYTEDMAKRIISEISNAKNKGIAPDDYAEVFKFSQDAEEIGLAFARYQQILKENNALDYDDLLIQTLFLLKSSAEAREYFQDKFKYIHIDEFQDTNTTQYEIACILAGKWGNIFAVGDEDQCIYTWRGAVVTNIFKFQEDFKCRVYKLEQNYRSTTNILNVANKIIKGNAKRLDKKLWTANGDGDNVVCTGSPTDGFEADFVIRKIHELVYDGEYDFSDCAILFRLNALTRQFEERCLQYGIKYRVYGGFKFYDRKEIKDILAYARLSVNTRDDEAVFRVINFPRRGIGDASIEKIRAYCDENKISAFDAIVNAENGPFPTALKAKLADYGKTLACLKDAADKYDVMTYFKFLLGILDVAKLFTDDDEARLENINELLNSVKEFAKNNPDAALFDYLQTVSLYSDTDDMVGDNTVTLATVHSAKGLEFPVVFVVGLEDGIFPSLRMNENASDHIEEERRLMYVAVTRAKRKLFLTYAQSRFLYGETRYGMPSRFLKECGLIKQEYNGADVFTNSPSYRSYGDYGSRTRQPYGNSYGNSYGGNNYAGNGGDRGRRVQPTYGGKPVGSGGESKVTPTYSSGTPKKVDNGDRSGFVVGAVVMHKRLGKGKIIGVENMGNSMYLKIEFDRGGIMMLAADFAPITVVKED